MGSYSVRLPVGVPLTDYFNEIPKQARTFLRNGFSVLGRVFPRYSEVLLSLPVDMLVSSTQPDASDLASKLGVPLDEATTLLGAVSFLALLASSPTEPLPVADTVAALVKAELLQTSGQKAVETFLIHFQKERDKVGGAFRKAVLSSRVLPSLRGFELAVDLRLDFEKEEIGLVVPIVLMHLETDEVHEEVWFQMGKPQVEKMIEDLKKTLTRLEQAEKWAHSRS